MDMEIGRVEISDLGVAAALLTLDHKLEGTKRDHADRVNFVFIETYQTEHVVSAYLDDVLDIKARAFFDNIKKLKGRIYTTK